jgi:glycosyltransferase 2 family protein
MLTANIKWKKILNALKYIYTPIIICCITYYSFKNSELFVDLFTKTKPVFLVCSVLLWSSLHLLTPISAKLILRFLGYTLPYKKLLKIHARRLPARYLPGGIWHTVGRLVDYRSCGIAKRDLSVLVFFETFLPVPVTFFIGGSLLLLNAQGVLPGFLKFTSTVTSFFLLLTPFFVLLFNPFKKYRSAKNIYSYLGLLLLSLFFWFLAASSFALYFYSVSLQEGGSQSFVSLAGTYVFSWGTGYISIFAPQGIGVFEVVAGKLIDLPLSLGSSVAFLAGFRLIALMADCLIYFSSFMNPFMIRKDLY